MSKTRYDIDVSYTDKGGTRRWLNRVGVLFMEGDRGSIVLTPGVSISSAEGVYINVNLPREQREQGGGQGGREGW